MENIIFQYYHDINNAGISFMCCVYMLTVWP